jgi:hypothetical protein
MELKIPCLPLTKCGEKNSAHSWRCDKESDCHNSKRNSYWDCDSRKYASDYGVVREILMNVSKILKATFLHLPPCVERTEAISRQSTSSCIFPLRSGQFQCGRPSLTRRFVACLISCRPELSSWPFHVGFVVHKVGLEQVFFRVQFPLNHCTSPTIHAFIHRSATCFRVPSVCVTNKFYLIKHHQ